MSQRINKAAIIISALFFILCIIVFLNRNIILHYVVNQKIKKVESQYGLSIKYGDIKMIGLNEIDLTHLTVVPEDRDTILKLSSMNIDLNPLCLLEGRIKIFKANTNGLFLNFVKQDSISNYDFIFKKKNNEVNKPHEVDYEKKVEKLMGVVFDFLPENGEIKNMIVKQTRDNHITRFIIPSLFVKSHHFDGDIYVYENGKKNNWFADGYINSGDKKLEASISPIYPTLHVDLPYIKRYYNASVSFDKVSFSISAAHSFSDEELTGEASITGLHLFHKRLSPDTISIDKGIINYNLNIGKNYIELDSTSAITINDLTFHPYIKAEKNKKWHIHTTIHEPDFLAQSLFSSLPSALFTHLQGLKVTGDLSYNFLLDVDFNNIDSLKFHSYLRSRNLRILDYGNSNLTKMNHEFTYTAYDNDKPVRTFNIGPSNPNYRSLDSISPILKNAIIQSEDNGFMYHNGFLPGAIEQALVHDLKVKKFARGGSTISMQLVKNVFLNRHKNIARKLEEALMVWLIENQHVTSKSRMYEVYLNLIEWAPMVYGAAEASRFYFNKDPMDLTINESIFLASLIPRPKQYRSFFNADGSLRENVRYFRLIAHRLMQLGVITEEQEASVYPSVNITGEAKNHIYRAVSDSDSIFVNPIDSISMDINQNINNLP